MMSDLAEIAAAAGISIIDTDSGDSVDVKGVEKTENKFVASELFSNEWSVTSLIQEFNTIFCNRYTLSDPEYASAVEAADVTNRPPCVTGFNCFRHRDDSRNWNRDRRNYGDRGGYRNRGNPRGSWNRHGGDGGDSRGWNRGDRPQDQPHSYGDHHHRGYGDQHSRSDNSQGHGNYQNRVTGYHQSRGNSNYQNRWEQANQRGRDDRRGHQNQRPENQGHTDRSRGEDRERSPQR